MALEATSAAVGAIAGKAMRKPLSLTADEIQAMAASCLTQRPNRKRPPVVRASIEINGVTYDLTLKPREW